MPVFEPEVDTNLFIICISTDKVACAKKVTSFAIKRLSLTLKKAQSLTGFLSFFAQAVHLGKIFMRCL